MKKTRFIPYGYTIRDGRLIVDHIEATIIRNIFKEYINGASLKEIASELTQRKVPYTEKTDVWDKARIARIIDNSKYIGDDEFDPIIDENIYIDAVTAKTARQRNTVRSECDGINLLRNRVKCEKCGSPMVRRICSKRQIKESWICENPECGFRVRISDGDLLIKITVIMNRIIENTKLMLPHSKKKYEESPAVQRMQYNLDAEVGKINPNEKFIMSMVCDMASQMYKDSQAKNMIIAHIAHKRVELMKPQENFNCEYFSDLIDYISLDGKFRVTLHTKTDTAVGEGEMIDGSQENT